jgi:hypothetical protein
MTALALKQGQARSRSDRRRLNGHGVPDLKPGEAEREESGPKGGDGFAQRFGRQQLEVLCCCAVVL